MRKALVFVLVFASKILYAQHLKVDNGIAASGFVNSKNLSLLHSKIYNYSLWIGSDFLEHKWYYLSSQVGYTVLGGKDEDLFIQNQQAILTERLKYLHLNTTFRAYKRISGLAVFAGIGPYANALISSSNFSSDFYAGYRIKPFHIGGKGEIGVTQDINKFRIGLVGSYLMSLTPVAETPYLHLNNNTFALSITAGYRFH